MEKVPHYTALERQRIKEKYEALSPEEKATVRNKYLASIGAIGEDVKPTEQYIATLTYKQLAKNYEKDNKVNVEKTIRKITRRMNKEKVQMKIVNKPGSIITTEEGSFMITKRGKSIKL